MYATKILSAFKSEKNNNAQVVNKPINYVAYMFYVVLALCCTPLLCCLFVCAMCASPVVLIGFCYYYTLRYKHFKNKLK